MAARPPTNKSTRRSSWAAKEVRRSIFQAPAREAKSSARVPPHPATREKAWCPTAKCIRNMNGSTTRRSRTARSPRSLPRSSKIISTHSNLDGETMTSLSVDQFREFANRTEAEVGKVIVGQTEVVRHVLVSILAGGHVLLEGVPGLGKTMLIRTLGEALELKFSRIQFTPDLMPADILGTEILTDQDGRREFRFRPGPLFANLVLADEINRATPKTQSALLEAMQEGSVTVAQETRVLQEPFFVLATQNPLEMEGTYPLPEAQLDRFFFKLMVEYSTREELSEVLHRTTEGISVRAEKVLDGAKVLQWQRLVREVIIAPHVKDYIVRL